MIIIAKFYNSIHSPGALATVLNWFSKYPPLTSMKERRVSHLLSAVSAV